MQLGGREEDCFIEHTDTEDRFYINDMVNLEIIADSSLPLRLRQDAFMLEILYLFEGEGICVDSKMQK